ncbi:MAG: 30S ribosomal protein S6 [Polyangia bacterium]
MARTLPKHRAREYETIFILHPETGEEGLGRAAERCRGVIDRLEGKLLRAENWGRRRLAYPVKGNDKGIYVYLRYLGYSEMVQELERNLRMLDPVIKYLTVKIEEDVDPDARPVDEEDISFVPRFQEAEPEQKAEPEKKPEPEQKAEPEKKPEPEQKAEPEKKAEPEQEAASEGKSEDSGEETDEEKSE